MNENTYSPLADSPSLVKTIAVLTLINGIVNIFWGLIATAVVVPTVILACLAVFTILPTILGVFEIIYALKLLNNPPQPVQPSTTIAILEILTVLTGNVFSMIVGILALVFYGDPQVKAYFARLNGIPYPVAPATPVPPAPPITPEPAPILETDSPVAPEAPVPPATPAHSEPVIALEPPVETAPEVPAEPETPSSGEMTDEKTVSEPDQDRNQPA